jgi:hypothetical protein
MDAFSPHKPNKIYNVFIILDEVRVTDRPRSIARYPVPATTDPHHAFELVDSRLQQIQPLRAISRTILYAALLYDLLFRASAATLLELAGDPKHLRADIGFLNEYMGQYAPQNT